MWARRIEGRSWEEKTKNCFAVLPTASFEYHGPQAPVGTDADLADYFAQILSSFVDAVVYPTVYYSACPGKTQTYSPTISIELDVIAKYYLTIMQGIQNAGFNKLVVLNAHDANMGVLRSAAEAMLGDFNVLIINWWQLLSQDDTSDLFLDGGRGHGGAYELSAAWATLADQTHVGDSKYNRKVSRWNNSQVCIQTNPKDFLGYAGEIDAANSEKGKIILERAEKALYETIKQWQIYLS